MNPLEQATVELVKAALKEDICRGDITSLACLEPRPIKAVIVAKSAGVLSGLAPAKLAFMMVDPATVVRPLPADGDHFDTGSTIVSIEGFDQTILTAERTALNFLAHLSGIATLTAEFVDRMSGTTCRILDTRKTTPGWRLLEKAAVVHGGGVNHRLGLYDMILIKDNHITAAGSVTQAIKMAEQYLGSDEFHRQFGQGAEAVDIEVEVTSDQQMTEAIKAGADRLLLDNQMVESLQHLVKLARQLKPDIKLEASGNVSLDNVAAIAATGVDYISIGALTHSAPASDFSLRVEE